MFYGQSNGTYEHYFRTFLRPEDGLVVEVVIIAVVVMINIVTTGTPPAVGPVGGRLRGWSIDAFLAVSVVVVVLLAELALYGVDPNFNPRCDCGANAGDEEQTDVRTKVEVLSCCWWARWFIGVQEACGNSRRRPS